MMLTVADIVACLERWAPERLQESWDNAGLCVGSVDQGVTGVVVCLDCTEEVVAQAVGWGANMIVSHHPLIFKGIKRLQGANEVERTLIAAIRNNMVVYCAHTNADKIPGGVSGAMAQALGLKNLRILEEEGLEYNGVSCGLGLAGSFDAPLSAEEFVARIKQVFGVAYFKASAIHPDYVQKVALCGGSGASLIPAALAYGAQAYVSGDFSYHAYFDVIPQMWLVDIGHYESEVGVLPYFKDVLNKKFPTFAVRITDVITNPIRIY